MSVAKSVTLGFVIAVVATVCLLAVGFVGQLDLQIPGVVGIVSDGTGGPPQTSLTFNPLATLVIGAVLSGLIWIGGRVWVRRRSGA